MDSFFTFLSNYYIWFLIAAAIFLFALIGLIIESAKKHKKNNSDTIEEAVAPVEAFRNESKGAETVAPTIEETVPETEIPAPEVGEAISLDEPKAEVPAEVAPEVAPVEEAVPATEVAEPLPVDVPEIETIEGPKQPEPIEDNTFVQEPAPVMDASPVFENVGVNEENVLPEPEMVEPINLGSNN